VIRNIGTTDCNHGGVDCFYSVNVWTDVESWEWLFTTYFGWLCFVNEFICIFGSLWADAGRGLLGGDKSSSVTIISSSSSITAGAGSVTREDNSKCSLFCFLHLALLFLNQTYNFESNFRLERSYAVNSASWTISR